MLSFFLSDEKMGDVHEFAFDVKLAAVIRVAARTEHAATQAIKENLDCIDLNITVRNPNAIVKVTEASAYIDDCCGPWLFEVDGWNLEGDC